jgi:putative transposase
LAEGQEVGEVARYLEATPATCYRWLDQYGGTKDGDVKKLKELERENQRLTRSVAAQALDVDMLKEVARVNH